MACLDMAVMACYLEADAPRVACRGTGDRRGGPVGTARSRYTCAFQDYAAWPAVAMPGKKAARLLRITWRSLQSIVGRVVADLAGRTDRLAGLRRIGIDEICWRQTST